MKRKVKLLLKILFTAAALWFVFDKVDIRKLSEALAEADPFWLFGALVLFNLSKIASALRLNLYFDAIGLKLTQSYNLILYYVGMFYNLFLPGGIGGDGYKVYLLNKHFKTGIKLLLQAVLLDRLSGLAGLVIYALLLFAVSSYASISDLFSPLAIVLAASVIPLSYLATRLFFRSFLSVFGSTMLWGLGVQFLQLICAWMILKSLGIEDMTIEYLTLFLVSSVVAVLPLTIGGVGIRELTFLYGLEFLGVEPSLGVTFSFLFFAITALSSLTGLFLLNRVTTHGEKRGDTPLAKS